MASVEKKPAVNVTPPSIEGTQAGAKKPGSAKTKQKSPKTIAAEPAKKVNENPAAASKAEQTQRNQMVKETKGALPTATAQSATRVIDDSSPVSKIGIKSIGKLSAVEFEKLNKNSEEYQALQKLLGSEVSYEKYHQKYNDFNATVAAFEKGQSGQSISWEEYVLFTKSHSEDERFTRSSWDGIAGDTKDGTVDANEDTKLSFEEFQVAVKLVDGYNRFLTTGIKYQKHNRFVQVDPGKIINHFNQLAKSSGTEKDVIDKLVQSFDGTPDFKAKALNMSAAPISNADKFLYLFLLKGREMKLEVVNKKLDQDKIHANLNETFGVQTAVASSNEEKAKSNGPAQALIADLKEPIVNEEQAGTVVRNISEFLKLMSKPGSKITPAQKREVLSAAVPALEKYLANGGDDITVAQMINEKNEITSTIKLSDTLKSWKGYLAKKPGKATQTAKAAAVDEKGSVAKPEVKKPSKQDLEIKNNFMRIAAKWDGKKHDKLKAAYEADKSQVLGVLIPVIEANPAYQNWLKKGLGIPVEDTVPAEELLDKFLATKKTQQVARK